MTWYGTAAAGPMCAPLYGGKDEKMFHPYPKNQFIYHAHSNYVFRYGHMMPIC